MSEGMTSRSPRKPPRSCELEVIAIDFTPGAGSVPETGAGRQAKDTRRRGAETEACTGPRLRRRDEERVGRGIDRRHGLRLDDGVDRCEKGHFARYPTHEARRSPAPRR